MVKGGKRVVIKFCHPFRYCLRAVPPFLLVNLFCFTRNYKRVVKGGKRVVSIRKKGGKGVKYPYTLYPLLYPYKGGYHPFDEYTGTINNNRN